MDPDHRLLLRSCQSLLQSRNSGVVLTVAEVFHYLAPRAEAIQVYQMDHAHEARPLTFSFFFSFSFLPYQVGKALVRVLRGSRETQYVILQAIATMSARRPGMFSPHLKSFFVKSTDPLFVMLLKIEVSHTRSDYNCARIKRILIACVCVCHFLSGDDECGNGSEHFHYSQGVPDVRAVAAQAICHSNHPGHWPMCFRHPRRYHKAIVVWSIVLCVRMKKKREWERVGENESTRNRMGSKVCVWVHVCVYEMGEIEGENRMELYF